MKLSDSLDKPVAVAVIGLPRSGTTITCSFLNSIEKASVWGEPHRSYRKIIPTRFHTRYGDYDLLPMVDVLSQIKSFAEMKNLVMYGFKEVVDPKLGIDPVSLVKDYGARIDRVLMPLRDPRKVYKSMTDIGHAKHMDPDEFNDRYIWMTEYVLSLPHGGIVDLDKFRLKPAEVMSDALDLSIEQTDSRIKLLQFTGGGDPHTIKHSRIKRKDYRDSWRGAALNSAHKLYLSMLE